MDETFEKPKSCSTLFNHGRALKGSIPIQTKGGLFIKGQDGGQNPSPKGMKACDLPDVITYSSLITVIRRGVQPTLAETYPDTLKQAGT